MPKKPNHKKKDAPPAARKVKKPSAKMRPAKLNSASAAFYVAVSTTNVAILREKPPAGGATGPCKTLEQARAAAIDALVAAIEDAERQLAACKRAKSVDELGTR